MSFGPNVQKEEVGSQATPLAEDFLKILQGELSTSFGTGVGPSQRESGTALRQFIQTLQGDVTGGGTAGIGDTTGSQRLIKGLEVGSQARTARSVGDLREQSGILNQRFGSSLAQGEALLRSEADASLDQLIGGIQEGQRQFDVGAEQTDEQIRQGSQQLLLQSIQGLFGQGQASLDFFRQLTSLGIFPEELIVSPSIEGQLLSGGIDIAASFAGAGRGGS